ncbi:MAG: DUF2141 domain-containing protein [Bacteroidetes bacterium]|nr:DUF2141 domain-containing protein [Bacteroidota bacterium]
MHRTKKNTLLFFAAFILAFGLQAQKQFTLTLNITQIEIRKAPLIIGLYMDEEGFKSKYAFDSLVVVPDKENILVSFKQVPAGNYAIALFQDVDGSGKLTLKGFGIPDEPVGISNYPLPGIPQPPKFKKAAFEITKDTLLTIPLMFSKDYTKETKKL